MTALPHLGLVIGTRAAVCHACNGIVEEVGIEYRLVGFLSIKTRAHAWQKAEHRCVPIAVDGCSDTYCSDDAHVRGGA